MCIYDFLLMLEPTFSFKNMVKLISQFKSNITNLRIYFVYQWHSCFTCCSYLAKQIYSIGVLSPAWGATYLLYLTNHSQRYVQDKGRLLKCRNTKDIIWSFVFNSRDNVYVWGLHVHIYNFILQYWEFKVSFVQLVFMLELYVLITPVDGQIFNFAYT